jgi:hypothetical protein
MSWVDTSARIKQNSFQPLLQFMKKYYFDESHKFSRSNLRLDVIPGSNEDRPRTCDSRLHPVK